MLGNKSVRPGVPRRVVATVPQSVTLGGSTEILFTVSFVFKDVLKLLCHTVTFPKRQSALEVNLRLSVIDTPELVQPSSEV